MNMHSHGWKAVAALALPGFLLFTACSFVQPQSDPTRFYLLSANPAAPAAMPAGKAPVVHLRQVELASYIKAKPVIVRRGDNEIEFREYARWGESLDLGIARVLREDLVARGAAGAVLAAGLRAADVDFDRELTVRVLACEGGADGAVYFRAVWELATVGATPVVTAHGDFSPADLKWDAKNEATLAAQLSAAVAGLSREIAAALSERK